VFGHGDMKTGEMEGNEKGRKKGGEGKEQSEKKGEEKREKPKNIR